MEVHNKQQYKRLFDHLDENRDGKICAEELQQCVFLTGKDMSFDEAKALLEAHDTDNDGTLDFEEFVRLVEDGTEEEKAKELEEAFKMYEMEEGCGCITPRSLQRMLQRFGEERSIDECREMIAPYDVNGDGLLNFDEFRIMMRC